MIHIEQKHSTDLGEKELGGFAVKISGDGKTVTNEFAALLKILLESDEFRPLARMAILANIMGRIIDPEEEENEPCDINRQIN